MNRERIVIDVTTNMDDDAPPYKMTDGNVVAYGDSYVETLRILTGKMISERRKKNRNAIAKLMKEFNFKN